MRVAKAIASTTAATVTAVLAIALPASAAGTTAVNYVALGDSYASGVAAGDYGNSGSCKRSSHAYPQLWANSHGAASFQFVACSGARTGDVIKQAAALNSGTTVATVSVGGNDAGFADTIETCVFGSDQDCIDAVDKGKAYARNTLPGQLDNTYATMRRNAPNARVYVLGYPHIYQVPGSCNVGMSDTKRSAINSGADTLAQVISGRAAAAGFTFVDARPAFSGHEICASERWINSVSYPVDESYHPNATGHAKGYYPALTAATG